jgi:nitroreductase
MIIAHSSMGSRTAPKASIIALSYLELAAISMGIGSCWAGYFNDAIESWTPMREAISLPEGHISFGAMMLGYPKYKYHRLPLRKEPKITWR